MTRAKSYFFCGIGGSGMLPLAMIVHAQGAEVAGSDRSLDQGRIADKFTWLQRHGIALFPQDGSGITSPDQILVTSAAIEDTVPDVQAARRIGAQQLTRPQLLAELFNDAPVGIAVAGTSGKSTVTGMIAWILHETGRDPVAMNGAVMKNFVTPDMPFASALAGIGSVFVSEVDESDGSIALYEPRIAVLTNITLDHKTMDELRGLFIDFLRKAEVPILNLDDPETRSLGNRLLAENRTTFSIIDESADYSAAQIKEEPFAISFVVNHWDSADSVKVRLQIPGRHNVSNALAAMAAVHACGIDVRTSGAALAGFKGLRRRFELVGTKNDISVIDDFGHNPDKITATLKTLHAFPGRLIVMFQPHGYGPLKAMGQELIDTFARNLREEDWLIMPDPAYFGGTVERTVGSADIIAGVTAAGHRAEHIPDRAAAGERIKALARSGDRIIIMGARDDSLSTFAAEVLAGL